MRFLTTLQPAGRLEFVLVQAVIYGIIWALLKLLFFRFKMILLFTVCELLAITNAYFLYISSNPSVNYTCLLLNKNEMCTFRQSILF